MTSARSQRRWEARRSAWLVACVVALGLPAPAPALDAFAAYLEESVRDPQSGEYALRRLAHFARSSDGGIRLATDDEITVFDATGRELHFSVPTRTVQILERARSEQPAVRAPFESELLDTRVLAEQELGMRDVEGFRALGTATTVVGCDGGCEVDVEEWRLPEHGDLLIESYVERRFPDGRIEGVRKRLYDLEFAEPDPSLFRIPTDYAVRGASDVSAPAPVEPAQAP